MKRPDPQSANAADLRAGTLRYVVSIVNRVRSSAIGRSTTADTTALQLIAG
jgi:hypothetical protein